jgi:hypothetical protein
MKRTALKHRSPRRPKWENLPLRRAYSDAHPFDPIARFFPEYAPGLVGVSFGGLITPVLPYEESATEVHHIGGGILGARRWDRLTFIIHLCGVTHKWCEKYQRDGFALCAAAKIELGEWDWDEMANLMGVESVMGWLESGPFAFDWPKQVLRDAMVRFQEVRA